MTALIVTAEMLRGGDPEVMDRYFEILVHMAERCIPPGADAESVARAAMAEVLSRLANENKPLPIKMLTRQAVGRAARKASPTSGKTTAKTVTPDMLRRGDSKATKCFFALLVRIAWGYVRNKAAAESIAREAMAEVLSRLVEGEPEDLLVWARTAVGRAARRCIRAHKRAPESFRSGLHTDDGGQAPRSLVQHHHDQLERIQGVIETLPAVTRQAIVATSVDGRRIESVATELGMPASTLRNQLRRARDKFRKVLASVDKLERLSVIGRQIRLTSTSMTTTAQTRPGVRRRRS